MRFDTGRFWTVYTTHFGHLPQSIEKQGTETLLGLPSSDPQITRLEWAAYILATIRNECGSNMQPVKEIEAGRSSLVWIRYQSKYWNTGYQGRGFSQITWKQNYEQFSQLLYGDDRLVKNPDLVMDPKVGYQILATGMVRGLFRRRSQSSAFKLSDFFNDKAEDPTGARQIVNGIGGVAYRYALRVTEYYHQYKPCLEASLVSTAPTSPVTPAPAAPTPVAKSGDTSGATPTPAEAPSSSPPPTTRQTYTVQPGDSFYAIAEKFNVKPSALAAANNMTFQTVINPGDVLNIPEG